MMKLQLYLQKQTSHARKIPKRKEFMLWINTVLEAFLQDKNALRHCEELFLRRSNPEKTKNIKNLDCHAAKNAARNDDTKFYAIQRLETITFNRLKIRTAEITVRLVDEQESAALNKQYRHKSGPTNILSFTAENVADTDSYYLGDLVICAPLVIKEAAEQNKILIAHWAHLTIHGVLHLLGYDHIKASEATIMEKLEINILKNLQYQNPYQ